MNRFRAALPHELDGSGPTKRDLPAYIERVDALEAEKRELRVQIERYDAELHLVTRAFEIAAADTTTASPGCACRGCIDSRADARVWYMNEARETGA